MASLIYGQDSGEVIPRSRDVASSSRSSASTTAAPSPMSDNSSVETTAPSQLEIKNLFKSLCRKYLKIGRPPTQKEMEPLWKYREHLDFEDMVRWRDEVGVKRGIIYDDGKIIFDPFTDAPHDEIVGEFNAQFDRQFGAPYAGTVHYPVWVHHGTRDIRIPGPKKQCDSSWGPRPRPQPPPPGAPIAYILRQSNGDLFPTLVLEVGNRQPVSEILKIRDRCLGWKTAINVFVLVAYNRNQYRHTDSWYLQVAVRDYTAPQPPPNYDATYPPSIVLYETPKVAGRYPLVNTPIPAPLNVYGLPTTHLYHPEAPPNIIPALPNVFLINVEEIRKVIARERRP